MSFSEEEYEETGKAHDLTGTHLQISTRFTNEYLYDVAISKDKDTDGQPTYNLVGGYAVDVFWYLQSFLNFTFQLRPDLPGGFDKTSVHNASLDLYLGSFSLLIQRRKLLDATFATGQSRILAFMDHNFEVGSANQNIFITPFTTNLWICGLLVWIIFLVGFLILNHFEKDSSVYDAVFHCITVTLQRGTHLAFFHNSTRIATVVLSFTLVIIMASYSGIMTSISAVSRYSINSIESLIDSNYKLLLEFGLNSNSSSIKFMLDALMNLSNVVKLVRRIEASKFVFQSFDDAIMRVKAEPSAYIIDEETGLFAISEMIGGMPCTWGQIPVFNLRYPWVMYMRKNASFKSEFNSGILKLRETGILRRIRLKWIPQPSSVCFSGSDFSFKSITFPQVHGAFQLLGFSMIVLCPLLFLAEKVRHKWICSAKVKAFRH